MKHYAVVPCLITLALLLTPLVSADTLTGQVVSDSGQGLPARVLAIAPQTRESALVYTKPDGHFSLEVPVGKLRVLATHGPEWSIAEIEAAGGEDHTLTLKRLVDMPARGYYGADLHMHSTYSDGRQIPAEVAYDCQAEGLQIAALTDHENVAQQPEWLAQANSSFLPLPGMEITTKLGHILGLDVRQVVANETGNGAADVTRIFQQVHSQGGFAILAHPNAPGENYQCPDVHDYDAMEILNGSLPPYGSVFDFVQGRKAWHAMLSRGLKVAAVGDSDNHDNLDRQARQLLQNPDDATKLDRRIAMLAKLVSFEQVLEPWGWKGLHPGFYRTYLQMPTPTPENVREAVRQGRGFVTNGPLLIATLDDQPPGSELKVGDRQSVGLKVETFANRPLDKLVVLVNGRASMTVAVNAVDGANVETTVPVKAGDWVAVESYGQWPEFATTNAWYLR